MTLTQIITRLELATNGSRGIDQEIADVIGHVFKPRMMPRYSRSFDAAFSLMLPGCDWDIGYIQTQGYVAHVMRRASPDGWVAESGKAPTAPLALCIAALKARQGA